MARKIVTANGHAQVSTAQSVFGGASALFDGNGDDFLSIPQSADWDFGAGDFTVEFRLYSSVITTQNVVCTYGTLASRGWAIQCRATTFRFYYSTNGTTDSFFDLSYTFNANTQYHVEIGRTGGKMFVFVNGTLINPGGSTFTDTIFNANTPFVIGRFGDYTAADHSINGWIDEFRLSKGICRHTADFTSPTQAYTPYDNDLYVKLLLHMDGANASTTFIDDAVYNPKIFGDNSKGRIGRYFANDPSLKGYYQLNGSSVDNSGNGNSGTDTAMSYIPKLFTRFFTKIGLFNGSTSYINIGNITDFQFVTASKFTLMFWFVANSIKDQALISKLNNPHLNGWALTPSASGIIQFALRNGVSTNNLDSVKTYRVGALTFVAATFNNGTAKIHMDGKLDVSGTGKEIATNAFNVTLGVLDVPSNLWWFDGYIFESALFLREVSTIEIAQYYQWATSPKKQSFWSWLPYITALFTETVTHTDIFLRTMQRIFIDSTTHTDTFINQKVKASIFSEVVIHTDTLYRVIARIFTETVTHTDSVIKTMQKILSEVITHTDSTVRLLLKTALFTETVNYTTALYAFLNGFLTGIWHRTPKPPKAWSKSSRTNGIWNKTIIK